MHRIIVASFVAASATSSLAFAQGASGVITFSGTVDSTCNLMVATPSGTLGTSPSLRELTSTAYGGTPGRVEITTTGGISVSVDPPSILSVPTSDTTPTDWRSLYRSPDIAGGDLREIPSVVSAAGSYDVDVHLTGTKTAPNTFHMGDYSATVTVRCEPQ